MLSPFFDLSFRHKIPIWGSLLIIVTALAVSVSAIYATYEDLKQDLFSDSESMSESLKSTLFSAMMNDDIWHAYEIIAAPNAVKNLDNRPETILVIDNSQRVVVSSNPKAAPMFIQMRDLNREYARLADRITELQGKKSQAFELPDAKHYYYVSPISNESVRLGTLIIIYPKDVFLPRFMNVAWHGLTVGSLILAILLPINWYWGQRMAQPLMQLAARMGEVGKKWPETLDSSRYSHRDELGLLFEAYNRMLEELKSKQSLEIKMVHSERLAALGQVTAGIAHEINNPLSGMLTAIDTLKCHSAPERRADRRVDKTLDLIERGLLQIKETVSALLVEAKVKGRNLSPQDIQDVLTLVTPMASKKALHIGWHSNLTEEVPLPATQVRQIMINLLLNALKATMHQGNVNFDICIENGQLQLSVTNDGKMMSSEQINHLFEPFTPSTNGGHGLGLWVTYQIVNQLGGQVNADNESDLIRFSVSIPIGVSV